jgi:hypothetical protein
MGGDLRALDAQIESAEREKPTAVENEEYDLATCKVLETSRPTSLLLGPHHGRGGGHLPFTASLTGTQQRDRAEALRLLGQRLV